MGEMDKRQETHFDARETEEAGLLLLEVLVYLVRVVAVHVRLLHEWEGDAVVALAELGDVRVVAWLLAAELREEHGSATCSRAEENVRRT